MSNQFTGFVSRQKLVDFCRSKLSEVTVNQKDYEAALESEATPEDLRIIHDAYAKNIGYQLALRHVTDWAANHHE